MSGKVAYLSPFFQPAVGGAAVYVSLLARELLRGGHCHRFKVITEKHPAATVVAESGLEVVRLFACRAGAEAKSATSYLKYGWQQIQLLWLVRHLDDIDVLFIHGSFLNNPGSIGWALRRIRWLRPEIRLVLDFRDPKFPPSALDLVSQFDAVISCSRNITTRLSGHENVHEIPIMLELLPLAMERGRELSLVHQLGPGQYIFNGSGLNRDKGIEQLVEMTRAIRAAGHSVTLAVAGKRRYWSDNLQQAATEGWFRPLGELTSEAVRYLASASWVDVNLSAVDSFPRHSLEALASGARVVFPPGVPELDDYVEWVAPSNGSADELAERVVRVATARGVECLYPWRRHLPDRVIPRYVDLLERL